VFKIGCVHEKIKGQSEIQSPVVVNNGGMLSLLKKEGFDRMNPQRARLLLNGRERPGPVV